MATEVATRRANNAERAGTTRKPSPESNLSCQRGERAPCLAVAVSNRQIGAGARPVLPGEVNKTLSASYGYNNMQREAAQQQRRGRPYSPPSPRLWKRTLAAPESRHDRPAAMTAHIPEVDSCYAADLTRCCLAPPFLTPRLGSQKQGSTAARKQSASAALRCRSADAFPPLSVAHSCTGIAQKKHNPSHAQAMRPFLAVRRLSPYLCWSCDPPPPPLPTSLPSYRLCGHAHFHAHIRPSSNQSGAVIYGARSFSFFAGNSNTWEDRGDGREGHTRLLSVKHSFSLSALPFSDDFLL